MFLSFLRRMQVCRKAQAFLQKSTILLATQQSFCASYLAQALSIFGLRSDGPFPGEVELQAWLDASPFAPAAIVFATDWLSGGEGLLPPWLAQRNIPHLLVENVPWRSAVAGVQSAFIWPYAAFQVVEALQDVVARSMGLLDLAPAEPQPG